MAGNCWHLMALLSSVNLYFQVPCLSQLGWPVLRLPGLGVSIEDPHLTPRVGLSKCGCPRHTLPASGRLPVSAPSTGKGLQTCNCLANADMHKDFPLWQRCSVPQPPISPGQRSKQFESVSVVAAKPAYNEVLSEHSLHKASLPSGDLNELC